MQITRIFSLWLVIFVMSYTILSVVRLVPAELSDANSAAVNALFSILTPVSREAVVSVSNNAFAQTGASAAVVQEVILPDHLSIEKIGVDAPIVNPATRDITVLDAALMQGIVRFPGSGGLDDDSNMFLFGHSTNRTAVYNQAYKSLNRLGELQIGDIITVTSGGIEYRYRVFSVSLADSDKALVEFSTGEKLLTLSTCDTFGARSDRFVVHARFIKDLP
ncbi:MAG: hypothetical protein A2664_00355 [Candidatus Taylorbacteria bacterium RIFCSPHIGHO2_01_FULL_46_22b]|uniref:Sortase n=1 Tax=Candidatus Taylorbacteria bacterium RIFCSPHIGHO2_01_FULL_46_22b TaxID=1802301 RepID=A0A1G2M437_9BACT|nr:MAG: hypothetical protein A2664_00355 [Candidatus Taylorbacteria bacterium RIFCSPHIGHO2_01_FULL_46_22b]